MRKYTTVLKTVQTEDNKTWNAIGKDTAFRHNKNMLRGRMQK